jgi:hypothetical protein
MRRKLLLTCAAVLLAMVASPSARATEVGYNRNFGLGIQVGSPSGFTGKYWVGNANALDFGFGFWGYQWGYCNQNGDGCNAGYQNYSFHMDYLWQSNLVKSTVQLDWHIGVGGRAIVWSGGGNTTNAAIGVRMPVGLDLMFARPNFLEVFFEIAPSLYLTPGLNGPLLEPALGVRFYF